MDCFTYFFDFYFTFLVLLREQMEWIENKTFAATEYKELSSYNTRYLHSAYHFTCQSLLATCAKQFFRLPTFL